ncbi:endonuclease/exonuclease/phosphatase family protein [Flavobacteriaceae bacterium R38]|nr:endonuclease/exonuclease/phosphatase family protein [Flavobacteriaceae bacterium R38]
MRIITWNCNMAFRKKAMPILIEKPDILIVPESESPEKLKFKEGTPLPNDIFWYGDNPNKGIGVYSYGNYTISKIKDHNPDFRYILPLLIKNRGFEFILLAIWCQKPQNGDNYGSNTWNAIHYYAKLLKNEKVIIAGDFNSNSYWDKPNREANHTNIVYKLNKERINSAYHVFYKEEQGHEKKPTFFLYKDIDKPYHLDYCFASDYFTKRLKDVIIGTHKDWKTYSDHMPLIIDFED